MQEKIWKYLKPNQGKSDKFKSKTSKSLTENLYTSYFCFVQWNISIYVGFMCDKMVFFNAFNVDNICVYFFLF